MKDRISKSSIGSVNSQQALGLRMSGHTVRRDGAGAPDPKSLPRATVDSRG